MDQKLVAFYRDRDTASAVREELIENGISRLDVSIYEGKEPGLWESVKETFGFANEDDRQLYHEAALMGGVAVVVDLLNATALNRSEALYILRNHNPVDLEGASRQLQGKGWQNPGAGYGGDSSDFRYGDAGPEDLR